MQFTLPSRDVKSERFVYTKGEKAVPIFFWIAFWQYARTKKHAIYPSIHRSCDTPIKILSVMGALISFPTLSLLAIVIIICQKPFWALDSTLFRSFLDTALLLFQGVFSRMWCSCFSAYSGFVLFRVFSRIR